MIAHSQLTEKIMYDTSGVLRSIDSANSIEELAGTLDQLPNKAASDKIYGLTKASKKARKDANREARDILERVGTDSTLLTEEDKQKLRAYSGLGGIGGSVHEYYTPQFIAQGVWDSLKVNGFENGNVGEPSAGAGVFNGTKPKGVLVTGSEMDGTSSQINQLLHPEDKIFNKTFEELAQVVPDNHFDAMTGNVPFSKSRDTAFNDPEYQDIKQAERYFITRMIDKVKPDGLISCIVPVQIIDRKSWSNWREDISRKAEFLGAHRLPEGTFKDNGTDVTTDVIILRKHSETTAEIIANLSDKDLESANVLWKPFISGKYFSTTEGKRFIHGDETVTTNRFGGLSKSVKSNGQVTQKGLQAKLARKFDSRINYDQINAAKPTIKNYVDGDQRKINGRWYELINGDWEIVTITNKNGEIDKAKYGVSSELEAKAVLQGGVEAAYKLSFDEVSAIVSDFSYLLDNEATSRVIDLHKFASKLKTKYRERVFKGALLGERIIGLQDSANKMRQVDQGEAAILRELVAEANERYGIASTDRTIANLGGKDSTAWNAFSNSTSPNGNFSDLLNGTLDVGEVIDFDTTNAAHVITQLHTQLDLDPVPFEQFDELYTGSDKPKTLSEVAKVEGIAITPDGNLMPFERATSGDIVKTAKNLRKALGQETDPNIKDNIERQLAAIEEKRKRLEPSEIEFTLKSKWIDRSYITKFLTENGYNDFAYTKAVENEDGETVIDEEYQGQDGVFAGYTQRANGTKRSTSQEIAFERQLENYLNGLPVRSKDSSAAARYKERIKVIEQQFGDWLRQHDDVDLLTDKFNDTFNGFIPFEHSNADLGLTGVSENVKLMSYQNSGIRRASEDGRGVIAYGTGLGKTFTALGLVAYNKQLGRSKRTCIVVPKAVLENWYHEIKTFYGKGNLSDIFIPSAVPVTNKAGEIQEELILDENGEPKINPHTNKEQYRDKITVKTEGAFVKKMLAKIPQSNYSVVVLTKEQFAKIPIRPESVIEHISNRVSAGALKGKYATNAKNYTEAQKNSNFTAKYADVGAAKWNDVPFFEDMGFDTVIADEGHNYRNSYEAGYSSSQLAYLPTAISSGIAVDMALKSEYLRKKNGGRGTVLLTATPTVNSPNDIYNILSLVISPDEWMQMGISDVDDFIEIYGDVALENITKLSGEIEEKEALVGFKNLSGLRNLFHRWVNLKNANDVNETVKIPKLEENKVNVGLTDEQAAIYEELRQKADALNEDVKTEQITLPDGSTAMVDVPNDDTTFGIIRAMDRVATDIDLYNRTMTFVLPKADHDRLTEVIGAIPDELMIGGDKQEPIYASHDAELTIEGDSAKLVVHEAFESEVLKAMDDAGIKSNVISHPVPPKYAQMIELMRVGLKDGKQIIFSEEKSQHQKLKRIIAHQLDMKESEIGIINADTVSGKKKNASEEEQEAGIEAIANAYNTGKHRVLIANKKAEVGINLHHGTTDLYHLTLPWTPASIDQRNGRGARVGSKNEKLRVHYMLGKGSFDEFRLKNLMHKKKWMNDLFTSNEEKMKNADATGDKEEYSLLLAANPEERAARDAKARKAKEAKIKQEKMRLALVDVSNYIKASHDSKISKEQLQESINTETSNREREKTTLDEAQTKLATLKPYEDYEKRRLTQVISSIKTSVKRRDKELSSLYVKQRRAEKAQEKLKKLKPQVDSAIKNGLIDVPASFVEQAANSMYDFTKSRILTVGEQYLNVHITGSPRNQTVSKRVVRIKELDIDTRSVTVEILFTPSRWGSSDVGKITSLDIDQLGIATSYTESELEIKNKLTRSLPLNEAVILLGKEGFSKYIRSGELELEHGVGLLVRQGDGFASIRGEFKDNADNIVYPDKDNSSLKKELGQWLLANRNELSSYGALNAYLIVLYGTDYKEEVENYGNVASDAQIQAWIQSELDKNLTQDVMNGWIDTVILDGNNFALGRLFRTVLTIDNMPSQYDNEMAFREAIEDKGDEVKAEVNAKVRAIKEKANNVLIAKVTIHDGKSNSDVMERLQWLAGSDLWGYRTQYNAFLATGLDGDYGMMDADERYSAVYSDLKRVGANTHLTDNIKKSVESSVSSTYTHERFKTGLAALVPKEEPSAINVERAEVATEVVKKVENTPNAIAGVTVELNAKPVTAGGNKVKRGSRWITTKAINYAAGEVYCLTDSRGKLSPLYLKREELKNLAGKGNYTFATDLNDDYPDAWWFFNSNAITLEQITDILEG